VKETVLEENFQLAFVIDFAGMFDKELLKSRFCCIDLWIIASRWFEGLSVI
jgi:hypothetical protein